jgi:hypothetical protein
MGQMCTLIHKISDNRIAVLIYMGSKVHFSDDAMNKIYLANALQDYCFSETFALSCHKPHHS